jgi:hypothetical protein
MIRFFDRFFIQGSFVGADFFFFGGQLWLEISIFDVSGMTLGLGAFGTDRIMCGSSFAVFRFVWATKRQNKKSAIIYFIIIIKNNILFIDYDPLELFAFESLLDLLDLLDLLVSVTPFLELLLVPFFFLLNMNKTNKT